MKSISHSEESHYYATTHEQASNDIHYLIVSLAWEIVAKYGDTPIELGIKACELCSERATVARNWRFWPFPQLITDV